MKKKVIIIVSILIVLFLFLIVFLNYNYSNKLKKVVKQNDYKKALLIIETDKEKQKQYKFIKKTQTGIYIFKGNNNTTYEVDLAKETYTVKSI